MQKINNRKILFISPKFFDHDVAIKNELLSKGAYVYSYSDISNSIFTRVISKLKLLKIYVKLFETYLVFKFGKRHIDYVFVIKGQNLDQFFFQNLKLKLQAEKFILYQWDSVQNFDYTSLLPVFDVVYSFDPKDCKHHNLKYLPLYFGNEYMNIRSLDSYFYDVSYIGQYLTERHNFITQFKEEYEKIGGKVFIHEYISMKNIIKEVLVNRRIPKGIQLKKLNRNQVIEIYSKSKSIIDMPSPQQSGYTMRTFETLGSHRKLITTNVLVDCLSISNQNLFIVKDRIITKKIILDIIEFNKNQFLPQSHIEYYSISNWLNNVFA